MLTTCLAYAVKAYPERRIRRNVRIAGCAWGKILGNDKATAALAWVGNEMRKIVRKRNIKLEELPPDGAFILEFTGQAGLEKAMQWPREYFEPHRTTKASMLQDMEKGRKCEIDYIVGPACTQGKRLGTPPQHAKQSWTLRRSLRQGKSPLPTMACLDRFSLPSL